MNYFSNLFKLAITILLFCSLHLLNSDVSMTPHEAQQHQPDERVTDWNIALQYLIDGNQRFIENRPNCNVYSESDRTTFKDGQNPFAVVLTCSDSRVAPEVYFDQRLGDIFVVRNAGNVYHSVASGSIEYAVEHLKVPLVVVVGHSQCGAVTGAFTGAQFGGNLQNILNIVAGNIEGSENMEEAIQRNMAGVVENIKQNEIIIRQGTVVIGAFFDIASGAINFCMDEEM